MEKSQSQQAFYTCLIFLTLLSRREQSVFAHHFDRKWLSDIGFQHHSPVGSVSWDRADAKRFPAVCRRKWWMDHTLSESLPQRQFSPYILLDTKDCVRWMQHTLVQLMRRL